MCPSLRQRISFRFSCVLYFTGGPAMTAHPQVMRSLLPALATRPASKSTSVAVAIGVLLSPDALAQGATAADEQRLEEKVEQLQHQIDKMQSEKQATGAAAASPPKAAPHVVQSESNKLS